MAEKTHAFISLGSNIEPHLNLPSAVECIACHAEIEVLEVSTVWESEPVGFREQANFCNAAIAIATPLSACRLKESLLKIEDDLQRVRDPSNKNGPRTIDLDIALFGAEVISDEKLQIPDPEIATRPFLAVPLAEVAGDLQHPVLQTSIGEIARQLTHVHGLQARHDIDLNRRRIQNID